MQANRELSFFTLLLMISFASVNAVLFTPGLPAIESFFAVGTDKAQQTITMFLIGYAIGQLLYGPIANRFGRKPALYAGILLQIFSSLLCVLAGHLNMFSLLLLGRFLLAFGSGVGLTMTFTLVNETYDANIASQKTAYLILAFAITPGLGVALGGFLTQHFGWMSTFYVGAIYGAILLALVSRLPETLIEKNFDALKIKHLLHGYGSQFSNLQLVCNGTLMGGSTSFIYIFSAVAPFVAINLMGLNSAEYGLENLLPVIGLVSGSLSSAKLAKHHSLSRLILSGILIACVGTAIMTITVLLKLPALISVFAPMLIIYYGLSFVIANAPALAMSRSSDKAHSSAVMSFLNMGVATVAVLCLGFFATSTFTLPIAYIIIAVLMLIIFKLGPR